MELTLRGIQLRREEPEECASLSGCSCFVPDYGLHEMHAEGEMYMNQLDQAVQMLSLPRGVGRTIHMTRGVESLSRCPYAVPVGWTTETSF